MFCDLSVWAPVYFLTTYLEYFPLKLFTYILSSGVVVYEACKIVAIVFEIKRGEESGMKILGVLVTGLVCLLLFLIASDATVDWLGSEPLTFSHDIRGDV